jgi:hypothetical protein
VGDISLESDARLNEVYATGASWELLLQTLSNWESMLVLSMRA